MHRSSLIANSLLAYPRWGKAEEFVDPLKVDLDETRRQADNPEAIYRLNPLSSSEEDKAYAIRHEVASAVYYIWKLFDFIDDLGWAEHTGDWDWWITVTTTDGVEHHADCGSEFIGLVDSQGELYTGKASEMPFHIRDNELTVLAVNAYVWDGDEDSTEGDYVDQEWRFDLDKISTIQIGYDT